MPKKPVQPENPIREWCEKNNMTQAQLAQQVGLQTASVNALVNDKNTNIKASNLMKIHEFTGIPYSKLVPWAAHQALEEEGWFEAG